MAFIVKRGAKLYYFFYKKTFYKKYSVVNIKNNKIFHFVEVSSEADIKTKDGSVPIRYAARPPLVDMELNPNDNFKLRKEKSRRFDRKA